jgi:DNA invertase Pin-like site-specific DNA recombinase
MELAKEQIIVAFEQSEKEVTDLRQRTKEGLMTAKLNGKQLGRKSNSKVDVRKKKPIMEIIKEKSKDFNGQNNDKEVIAIINSTLITINDKHNHNSKISAHISRNTYYKYKKELSEKIQEE